MPPPLSYPALKLVLEYLDVKKRYHITSRNNGLQKIDYLIPLRVGTLTIWKDTSVSLDYLEYKTDYKGTFAKLMKKYLEGKPNIHVGCVGFYYVKSYKQVPLKLNLITNTLVTIGCSNFSNLLPIIDSRSFPLKKLQLFQDRLIYVDHPVVNTTEDVIFQFEGENELIKGIEKLHRKKLSIHNVGYENIDAVKIINDWIKNGREVGTEYLLGFTFDFWMKRMLRDLKNEFDEFKDDLEGINVRFLAREPRFLIPISPTSKIIIYGTEIQSKNGTVYQLVLKVVSTEE
ncbi:hypothetical protein CRE_17880 [Caenorhabditis remanei]|uniref:F-box associated domain-containing protein n=1 Tax=Caenorhabditis remanei TaxID=31234 RepID=E3MDC9_CAERE|nr:hypothetical protein CRE_17880 [Caenorhabditis remanei]